MNGTLNKCIILLGNRNKKCSVNVPSCTDSSTQGKAPYPQNPRPCRQVSSLPSKCNQIITSFVIVLRLHCRPPNIARRIIPVRINTIDAIARAGTISYFSIEFFKRCKFASDTTPPIILPLCGVGVRTPRSHSHIGIVNRSATFSMYNAVISAPFNSQTAAAFDMPSFMSQSLTCNLFNNTAVTSNQPQPFPRSFIYPFNRVQGYQFTKPLGCEILKLRHESPPVVSWIEMRGDLARKPSVGSDPYAANLMYQQGPHSATIRNEL